LYAVERVAFTAVLAMVFTIAIAACTSKTSPEHPVVHHPVTSSGMQRGLATFYADPQQTASGERFDKHKLTAAHRTLPFGTRVRVTNTHNGRTVEVRINDRGPFGHADRIIDLSEEAARQLGMLDAGVVPVTLEVVK
jgi:rare lipoprotein A